MLEARTAGPARVVIFEAIIALLRPGLLFIKLKHSRTGNTLDELQFLVFTCHGETWIVRIFRRHRKYNLSLRNITSYSLFVLFLGVGVQIPMIRDKMGPQNP